MCLWETRSEILELALKTLRDRIEGQAGESGKSDEEWEEAAGGGLLERHRSALVRRSMPLDAPIVSPPSMRSHWWRLFANRGKLSNRVRSFIHNGNPEVHWVISHLQYCSACYYSEVSRDAYSRSGPSGKSIRYQNVQPRLRVNFDHAGIEFYQVCVITYILILSDKVRTNEGLKWFVKTYCRH